MIKMCFPALSSPSFRTEVPFRCDPSQSDCRIQIPTAQVNGLDTVYNRPATKQTDCAIQLSADSYLELDIIDICTRVDQPQIRGENQISADHIQGPRYPIEIDQFKRCDPDPGRRCLRTAQVSEIELTYQN